ncbi:methyltransferase domain-containing protein [Sphingobium algorifonticola]|uniref:Methyltransferase domain-containing protein n=1 Tax=Sphingobium algorifonticola TaxID=2008318 RepID=A0A437JCA5_9SPHN|nr:methyltransferase domain-containing protein [Sphingobium algorifonticola]RVT43511.1 methyltransferase domain-containing protein [Sphingobium algorifonticola]
MGQTRKDRIAAAFGAAAEGYEAHAPVQRYAARAVADLAGLVRLPGGARILEIGCGTGLLTREIGLRWPGATLVATDLAAPMVAQAARGGMVAGTFMVMDGERPVFDEPHFDLILSSLAFQWFDDLAQAIARLVALLRPGGRLIFSTMGAGSFAAWRAAHNACGVQAGVPDYPTLDELRAMLATYADSFAFDETYPVAWGSGRALVAHLKGIGAVVPIPGRGPLSPPALRCVMKAFDTQGGSDAYHVLFGRVTRL